MSRTKEDVNGMPRYMGVNKFRDVNAAFHAGIDKVLALDTPPVDLIHLFPIYTGHANLAKYLTFYDLYKQCFMLSGHIADIGTWKGASLMFMAKLIKIFEPYSITQAHGFDWFQGMSLVEGEDDVRFHGTYPGDYERLVDLIEIQALQDTALVHKMDLAGPELDEFFERYPHLRFKMIYMDCGATRVLENVLSRFWDRLVVGGVMMIDHYNMENSPQESRLVEACVGRNPIRQSVYTRQPSAYVVKEHA